MARMFLIPRCWCLGLSKLLASWGIYPVSKCGASLARGPRILDGDLFCLPRLGIGTDCLEPGLSSALCAAWGTWGRTPSSALRSLLSEQTKLGITQFPDANSEPGHASSSLCQVGTWEMFQSISGIPVKALSLSFAQVKDWKGNNHLI
uniref:Uncharacterized protein n=1 Tax=Molossus molossus TaxID=27622 RepID=A0A7J8J1L0_MOLMO|nr:hypothetical protein HJG59_010396 [Molossus molossus]